MGFCKAFWLVLFAALLTSLPLMAQGEGAAGADRPAAAAPTAAATDQPAPAGGQAPAGAADSGAASDQKADGSVDGATYLVRMRDLEQRVDRLKEQIRRSHTRLSLLSETVLSGGIGGARARIGFTNDVTSAFRVERVLVVLDGAVQYNKQDTSGKLSEQKEIPIFSGSVPPGDHTLQVLVRLRGYGYGIFSYLQGYRFEVKSAHSFTVTEGKSIEIEVVLWEKGGVTTPLEQRPAIRYVERLAAGGASATSTEPARQSGSGTRGSVSVGTGGR